MSGLPNLFVIGVQRGGTSSMFNYLQDSQDISGSSQKEPHYFDSYYDRGLNWYKSLFPKTDTRYVCEASPHYLGRHWVPQRIADTISNPMFIVLLRNPVERVWSHYCRRRKFINVTIKDMENTSIEPYQLGLYYDHFINWFKHFDRSRFIVSESDIFYSNTADVMNSIFRLLGVDPIVYDEYEVIDPCRGVGRDKFPMPDNIREIAEDFYREPNKKLNDLIGIGAEW